MRHAKKKDVFPLMFCLCLIIKWLSDIIFTVISTKIVNVLHPKIIFR